ncbi:MAG: AAA family ATPase [Oscillospiraceae bacterium]|nr:AAA family ATPase [Oscillospiraceae bacterium]
MGIKHVKIEEHLVFEHRFTTEFCSGVNVLIGGNGTGKTTLMRAIYDLVSRERNYSGVTPDEKYKRENNPTQTMEQNGIALTFHDGMILNNTNCIFIPEKDILEHSKGLLTFIEQKQTGFSELYKDVLVAAMDVPTKTQTPMQKSIGKKISDIIGGYVEWMPSEGAFYMIKTNGNRIPFAREASGFKRLGFLGLLLAGGQIKSETILFWDEPENSLNPELVPMLVDILIELAQNGVQMFIATHDYEVARYFDVRKNRDIPVMFHNFSKGDGGHISCASSAEYIKIPDNLLESAGEAMFRAVAAFGFGIEDDDE